MIGRQQGQGLGLTCSFKDHHQLPWGPWSWGSGHGAIEVSNFEVKSGAPGLGLSGDVFWGEHRGPGTRVGSVLCVSRVLPPPCLGHRCLEGLSVWLQVGCRRAWEAENTVICSERLGPPSRCCHQASVQSPWVRARRRDQTGLCSGNRLTQGPTVAAWAGPGILPGRPGAASTEEVSFKGP